MRISLISSAASQTALAERRALVHEAFGADVDDLVSPSRADVRASVRAGSTPYLLDVNASTTRVALELAARRVPYILDTGDDPGTLAIGMGLGRIQTRARRAADAAVVGGAAVVICRGTFHRPILRAKTHATVSCVPDTVPDDVLDQTYGPVDPHLVATFGSIGAPASGDRAYGWELVDLVASMEGLRGLIVGGGAGVGALRSRARRRRCAHRIEFHGWVPLGELCGLIGTAGAITSVQSDDLAGWVRTTGKLPLSLGVGRVLLATGVGEATLTLPPAWLIEPGTDEEIVAEMRARLAAGVSCAPDVRAVARAAAERFRRSHQAGLLRSIILAESEELRRRST